MTLLLSVFLAAAGGALVAGLLLALCRQLKALVAARVTLTDFQSVSVSAALYVTALAMLPATGSLTDAFGARPVLASGSLLAAVAVAVVALTRGFGGLLVGALLLGNSCACLTVASAVLLPAALSGVSPVAALNLGFIFLTGGALAAPGLLAALTRRFGERRGLGLVALATLLPAFLAAFANGETPPAADAAEAAFAGRPEFWLIAVALFLYFPVEYSLSLWAPRYLGEVGLPERPAGWVLAGFWFAFLAGRLLTVLAYTAGWVGKAGGPWLELTAAVLAAVFLGNLVGARGGRGSAIVFMLVGALLGPLFPTLAGLLFERFPPGAWGSAFGAATALGWLGGLTVEPLIGAYVRRTDVRHALWVLLVGLMLMAFLVFVLGIGRNL